jgi:hypothetical protein
MNQIVFRFNSGFGNRLCNLMNMFYIHEKFPDSLIYIDWVATSSNKLDIS